MFSMPMMTKMVVSNYAIGHTHFTLHTGTELHRPKFKGGFLLRRENGVSDTVTC